MGALTAEKEDREGGGKFDVLDGVVFHNGQNCHQNYDRTQVFRSFRVCQGRGAFLHPPLFSSPAWFTNQQPLPRNATFNHLYRLSHGLFIPSPHYHGNHLPFMFTDTYHRPDPFSSLPSFTLLPSGLPRRCLGLVSTPFTHPPSPFYICCNPCCSSSFNLHCT